MNDGEQTMTRHKAVTINDKQTNKKKKKKKEREK